MATDLRREMIGLLPRLRAFALALTRNGAEADDLVQTACERALRGAEGFRPDARLDSWMLRIVHNAFVDQYRRKRHEVVADGADPVFEREGSDGRMVIEDRSELGAVWRALARLPEEQRSVMVLVCVEGLSYRETAQVLDTPVGTVMSRLARARQAIAAHLSGAREGARASGGQG